MSCVNLGVGYQYDRLSATLERVIQDIVFNGVVKRYRDWIRIDLLEGVIGFSRSECETIQQLHKRCCNIVTAHDLSSSKNLTVPSARDLANDIETLKNITVTIRARRKRETGNHK